MPKKKQILEREFIMKEISPEKILKEMHDSTIRSGFIKLDGKNYRDGIKWNDCHISMGRLPYSLELLKIDTVLIKEESLQNTSKDSLGRGFIGNINWKEALKLNLMLGGKTITLRQYSDFLKLLESGKAYDGNGARISSKVLKDVYKDITRAVSPWRAEWIDGEVIYKDGEFYFAQDHFLDENRELTPKYIQPLKKCLMEDRIPGISLENWLKNPTKQGFPKQNIQTGDVYYMCPCRDNNSVARIFTSEDGMNLGFDGDKYFRSRALGVRLVLDEIEL